MNIRSALSLLLLPQLLFAQVKTGAGAISGEAPGGAGGANAKGAGASGGVAEIKLSVPVLGGSSFSPQGPAPAVRRVPTLPAAAVPQTPSLAAPTDGDKKPADFQVPQTRKVSAEQPYFSKALTELGVPADIAGWLGDYQKTRHPGDQDKIYHGLKHSQDVPDATARVLASPKAAALTLRQRVMLIVAAALHDIDPRRKPGNPAWVPATLTYLDTDPESRALLAEVDRLYGVTPAQIKTLIMATDFNQVAEKQALLYAAFEKEVDKTFAPEERAWAKEWGRRLSFIDKVASYIRTPQDSDRMVRNLSFEIRTGLEAATGQPAAHPTEEEMLQGSYRFQLAQKQSPDYDYLPADLKANFEKSLEYFRGLQWTPPSAIPKAQAQERAPPASALSELGDLASKLKTDPASIRQAGFFKSQTALVIGQIKRRVPAASASIAKIASAQERFKKNLVEGAASVLKGQGLSSAQVASHGTTLKGLWGMLISGGIEATSSYAGFSGESAEVWAGQGIEGGASYGAKRGVYAGLPGVEILLYNKSKPMKVVGGETLDRRPSPKEDFLAAVITDGEKTLVLDRAQLAALAASADQWKNSTVERARAGSMNEFNEWDRIRDFFDPSRQPR